MQLRTRRLLCRAGPALLLWSNALLGQVTSLAPDHRASSSNPPLISTGLKNLGNTCYLNAQLQCAFHIPFVRKLMLSKVGDPLSVAIEDGAMEHCPPEESPALCEPSEAMIALRNLFNDMAHAASQDDPAVSTTEFCGRLGIPPSVQQDSQEFWKLLLPAVNHEALSELYKGTYEDYIIALDGSGQERRREELFLDISLDVGNSPSLLDVLRDRFGEPEILRVAEGNGWRPQKGAKKVDAHKGTALIATGLPPILQFHLKRFAYDWQTDTMSKLNNHLSFPVELDLSPICKSTHERRGQPTTADSTLTQYDLQSIVVHYGECGAGHYYAYVRPDLTTDEWYRFNDGKVEKVSIQEVLEDAYGGSHRAGLLQRVRRIFQGKTKIDLNGWGGRTSNAYVVQYVRKQDRARLY